MFIMAIAIEINLPSPSHLKDFFQWNAQLGLRTA